MIKICPWCKKELSKENCCKEKGMRNNLVDSSIFLEAYDESEFSEDCKLFLEGAKERVYLGNVSTIILGELMKKLLKIKHESDYRFPDIYSDIIEKLKDFRILYICDGTIQRHSSIDTRDASTSQDKLNIACAVENNCSLFIMKDRNFSISKKITPTKIVQITDKNNSILKGILDEIKISKTLNGQVK